MSTVVDVLVVGGGPAGLAAAIELRRLGATRVVVLEREQQAGGIPRHSDHLGFGLRDMRRILRGPAYAERYARFAKDAGVEVRTGTSVTGWAGPHVLELTSADGRMQLSAQAVLLATGCRERPRAARLVPGSRPLGVLTTGPLQQFVHLHHQPVGRRAVVVGAEHVSFSAVLTLAHAGARTVAMVTDQPRHQTYAPLAWLVAGRRGVPVLTSSAVTQILGRRRVEAVEVVDLVGGGFRQIACDTVVFTGDWIPEHELARSAGLAMDPGTRAPRVDGALRTSAPGVFAAGNLLHGAETADVAALSGRHAARAVDAFLRSGAWPLRPPVPVECEAPLRWVSPSAIDTAADAGPGTTARAAPDAVLDVAPDAVPHGHFLLRAGAFSERVVLEVRQDDRRLWQQRYRRLVPNRSIRASAAWIREVDPNGGPIRFRVAS
jgi:thioredoxin reductase